MGDEEERRAQLRQQKHAKKAVHLPLVCGRPFCSIRLSLVAAATFTPSMGTNHCTAAASSSSSSSKTYQPYFRPLRNISSPVAAAT